MTITLTPEQEQLVIERVRSGQYLNPEHLASEAFRLLTARDQHELELTALRQDIDAGWEDAETGRLLNGPQTMAALLLRARDRVDARG
jgi:putative addiction module CopG family antidote